MSGDKRVRVRVPASTANLGSGFDVLGLALGLYNTVEMEAIPQGIELTVTGEGAERLAREGGRSLVVRAAHAAFAHLGVRPPARSGRSLVPDEVLRLALPLEGHRDNITPSLVGGLTATCVANGAIR